MRIVLPTPVVKVIVLVRGFKLVFNKARLWSEDEIRCFCQHFVAFLVVARALVGYYGPHRVNDEYFAWCNSALLIAYSVRLFVAETGVKWHFCLWIQI